MRHKAIVKTLKYFAAWITAAAVVTACLLPSLPAKASSVEDECFFYLTDDLGYSVAAACGIMANIRHESNFHPGALNSAGSYGLCQWTGGRRDGVESYCYSHGFGDDSLKGQLSYLDYELRSYYPGIYNYLMSVENSSSGAYNAAYEFCYSFERPADRSGQSSSRGNLASGTYWNRYKIYAFDQFIDTELGRVYHYTDGTLHYGWLELEGDRYYLGQDGILKIGLFSAEGATYFADEDGIIQTGWQTIGDSTYFFNEETGAMQVGWIEVDGRMYFLDGNGKLTSINAFNDKVDISDADIQNTITESESEPETTMNAPAVDPVPIPDKLTDAADNIQNAGSNAGSDAAAVATPGQGTEIRSNNPSAGGKADGSRLDTSGLEVGDNTNAVTMEDAQNPSDGSDRVVFEEADMGSE